MRWPPPITCLVACTMLVGLLGAVAGLVKSLPYAPESDESVFVDAAVRIAARGDLDPYWFGHPGATVIYPLAAIYRAVYGGGMHGHTMGNISDLYLLGRGLSVAYAIFSLPLVFAVGRRVFGTTAALIGTWLMAVLPIAVAHAQVVRTDSAGVFWGLLAVWLSLSIGDQPTFRRVALAGIAVGVAIATRYFMVALLPVLLGATLVAYRHSGASGGWVRPAALGCAAAVLGFLLTSPYALLDSAALQKTLRAEAETTDVGADGLSPVGNFVWYLTNALPADLTWPAAGLGLLGIVLALATRSPERLHLLGYAAVFLVLISASPLHWHRWSIQILPVLALFCGYAIQNLTQRLRTGGAIALAALALVSIQPGYQLVTYDVQQIATPPAILAREWILANLPRGTRLAVEGYGPPLAGLAYANTDMFTLAEPGGADDYGARGYRYLVVSSAVYDRYFSEPHRYASQVAFYTDLFARGRLVAEFDSPVPAPDLFARIAGAECTCALHPTRGGPTIRIYAI
ncbi:MAG: glycosyltransferase family 39 protein [Chloroflexi bacterium]|nr:glycosyltransferase family 39 protein [Chloroflexota bacterium]